MYYFAARPILLIIYMKRLSFVLFSLVTLLISATTPIAAAITPDQGLDIIKKRYIDLLISESPDEQQVKSYLDNLDLESGAWRDIDYASTIGSGWKTNQHPARASQLARYYVKHTEESSLFTRQEVEDAIHAVWRYWFTNKPHCKTNWFPNVIACPKGLNESFLLMHEQMSAHELECAEKIVFPKTKIAKTGANLISQSNIVLMRALIQRDAETLQKAIDAVASTIFMAETLQEGIQPDYSFHQHGPQQQFGNYGSAALRQGFVFYANLLRGTPFALSEEKMDLIVNLVYEGFDWVLWRGYMDINASGRQFSEGNLARKGAKILETIEKLKPACNSEQLAKIESVIKGNQAGAPIGKLGQKSFYCSDGMYHRTPTWGASLKMSSAYSDSDRPSEQRLAALFQDTQVPGWARSMLQYGTRIIGGEQGDNNIMGYYIADGAFYTYVDGDEYEDAVVLWDWRKIPGITCYDSDAAINVCNPISSSVGVLPPNQSDFVGTCTDSKSGITAMNFKRDGIVARKSWVVTDEFVLSLGSCIGTESGAALLTTTIDQKLAKSDLQYLDGKEWVTVDGEMVAGDKVVRLYHDKTGYIILGGSQSVASIKHRTGMWNAFDRANAPKEAEGDLFTAYVRHTKQGDSYQYITLPARSRGEVAAFDLKSVDVVRNDGEAVIVRYDGVYYISAFESGVYKGRGVKFEVKTPGLFMLKPSGKGWSVVAHDPTKRVADGEFASALQIL